MLFWISCFLHNNKISELKNSLRLIYALRNFPHKNTAHNVVAKLVFSVVRLALARAKQ